MSYPHDALRANHVGGHVAMAVVPYMPSTGVSAEVRERFQPWACTFHCNDGGPRHFVAFGGQVGMLNAVTDQLGPKIKESTHADKPTKARPWRIERGFRCQTNHKYLTTFNQYGSA